MASKRTSDENDHQNNDDTNLQIASKRRRGETIDHSLLTVSEPVLRRLLQEVIPPMLRRYVSPGCRWCRNRQGDSSEGRALQLCFVNELPRTIFTMANLTAEDGGPIKIELRDAASQQCVDRQEFSTIMAQIYVLDGGFGNEEWTAEEFVDNIAKAREGMGPLLKGETVMKIVKGVGFIGKIKITDISFPAGNKTFRLGVKIVGINPLGAEIREARSEPFRVKDKRGESIKKSERPSLNDEVWRLKHIRKAGELHKQLSQKGIKTVKDLLRLNAIGSLQKKFSKFNKSWDRIIEHAKDCELNCYERYIYTYEPVTYVSLIFNCIYELVEVIFHGQHRSLQSLDPEEKGLVERIKLEAYSNPQHLQPYETQTDDIVSKSTGKQVASYSAPYQVLQLPAHQGQTWPSTSISIIDEPVNSALVVDPDLWLELPEEFESYIPDFNPNPNPWEQPTYFSSTPCSKVNNSFLPNTDGYLSSRRKTKTVWQKLRNTLKWVLQPHKAKRKNQMCFFGQN